MRLLDRLVGRVGRRASLHGDADTSARDFAAEPPARFSDVLAAAAMADCAVLPLELWPGYRSVAAADRDAAAMDAKEDGP